MEVNRTYRIHGFLILPAIAAALLLVGTSARAEIALGQTVFSNGHVDQDNQQFRVRGTLAEPAIGAMGAGVYELEIGFWHASLREYLSDVADEAAGPPLMFHLGPNYPDPFTPTTAIPFILPRASHVTLEVFDLLGRRVTVLVDDELPAGVHTVAFSPRNMTSGVYAYRIQTNDNVSSRRMVLVR